jgi:uncharacterized protein YbjQ (UPF0145 family)
MEYRFDAVVRVLSERFPNVSELQHKDNLLRWLNKEDIDVGQKWSSLKFDYIFNGSVSAADVAVEFLYWHEKLSSQKRIAEEQRANEQERAEQAKHRAMSQMLITSGFSFDGYKIIRYSGYISGDDAIQVPRNEGWFGAKDVSSELMKALVKIRRNALQRLKEAAFDLDCNAVIGVDFDYITLDPSHQPTSSLIAGSANVFLDPYVFGVTANGNAVVIQKT